MWNCLLFIFKWILIILSPFFISYIIHFLYYYFVKEMRFKSGEYKYIRLWKYNKKTYCRIAKTNGNR